MTQYINGRPIEEMPARGLAGAASGKTGIQDQLQANYLLNNPNAVGANAYAWSPELDANAYQYGGQPGGAAARVEALSGEQQRYQDMGLAGQGRDATQMDPRRMQQDRLAAGAARMGQMGAAGQYYDALQAGPQTQAGPFTTQAGPFTAADGPSAAQAQLQAGTEAAIRSQMAAANSARGGAMQQAAAQRMAGAQGDVMRAQAVGQATQLRAQEQQYLTGLRSQEQMGLAGLRSSEQTNLANIREREMNNLRSGYAAQMNAMRGQDLQQQGISTTQAQINANLEAQQREVNDRYQIAMENFARGTSTQQDQIAIAQMQALMEQQRQQSQNILGAQGINAGIQQNTTNANNARRRDTMQFIGGLASAAGGTAVGLGAGGAK